jgi:hypothetical protein
MGLQFIINHLMNLFLQKSSLLIIKGAFFFKLASECFLGHFEVVLDDNKGILKDVFQNFHLLFDNYEVLFGLRVKPSRELNGFLDTSLDSAVITILFLMGTSPIIVCYINDKR